MSETWIPKFLVKLVPHGNVYWTLNWIFKYLARKYTLVFEKQVGIKRKIMFMLGYILVPSLKRILLNLFKKQGIKLNITFNYLLWIYLSVGVYMCVCEYVSPQVPQQIYKS